MIEESEFKGNKMLVLKKTAEDKWPFQFGLTKAKLILENVEGIKEFVAKYDKAEETEKE